MASAQHTPDGSPSSALRTAGLRFRYANGPQLAFPDIDLPRGGELLLVGRSGCGKSTLLQLVAGLLDPSAGSVAVGGHDMHAVRGAARDRLRGRSVGMVFQTFQLLQGFSALENVLVAMSMADLADRDARARADGLLRSLGIERLDARVEDLSVGQQQRVAIARALACRPALVLADEPTASLDPENAMNAVRVLRDACRDAGAALLVVSHDPALEPHFERRMRLATAAASTANGPHAAGQEVPA